MSCLEKINIAFICTFLFMVAPPLLAQCNTGTQVGDVVTPYWREQNGFDEGVPIPNISSGQYALVNVIKGVQYEINAFRIRICRNGGGEHSIDSSNWVPASTRFTADFSGQVRVYYTSPGTGRNIVIKIIGGINSADNQGTPPNQDNRWRTHFYREMNNFTNYLGYKDYDNHSFNEYRHPLGDATPIEVRSQGTVRAGILRYFTARSLMRNTFFSGFYYVKLGADDGTRLFINNEKVYDRWNPAGDYFIKIQVIKLSKGDQLKYEYFNNNIPLQYIFEIDPVADKIIENKTLTSSNGEKICIEETTTLDGDSFREVLPNIFTNPTYQWYYAKSLTGTKQPIGGNTRNYEVNTNTPPFNNPTGGIYYFFREARITINNIGVAPKTESIMSDPIELEIIRKLNINVNPNKKSFCQGGNDAYIRVEITNHTQPPFTFRYKINGLEYSHVSNNRIFTIPINTSQAGTFKYDYVSITDGNGCTTKIHKADNINIIAPPTAVFSQLNTNLCLIHSEVDVMNITSLTGGFPPFQVSVKITNLQNSQVKTTVYNSVPPHQNIKIYHTPNEIGSFKYEIIALSNKRNCTTTYTDKSFIVTVTAPSIAPPENLTWCLPYVVSAVYNESNGHTDVSGNRYVLPIGNTDLDVTINPVPCCPTPNLKWTINNDLSNVRTGQPSAFMGEIAFENDTSTDKTYNITYWLECNGQKYNYVTRQIRITPRPIIEFN
ncbi:hypothetical protein ACILDS_04280 [Capnocytophaga canis]|uniref:hypothetical protein n=1 Tax=Capnocytophaga canis TaxID=1848903 RepID=UPI0037D4DA0F